MKVDTIPANVFNLKTVLKKIEEILGVKPFLHINIQTDREVIPMTLVQIGEKSLEFLECAKDVDYKVSLMTKVIAESPEVNEQKECQLEPKLTLVVRPGKKKDIVEIHVNSYDISADATFFEQCCEAKIVNGNDEKITIVIENTKIVFFLIKDKERLELTNFEKIDKNIEYQPGWRRIGLSCKNIKKKVEEMTAAGARVLLPIYKVMPGLKEAMLLTPSGLVVQPISQKLHIMIPVTAIKWLKSKITGKPMIGQG